MRLAAFLLLIVGSPALAQLNALPNGDFDVDVSGWTYAGPASGSIAWEAVEGDPVAGSLRLSTPAPVVGDAFQARSATCVAVGWGETWTAEAKIKHVVGLGCSLQMLVFPTADCTGEEGGIEPLATGGQLGVWTPAAQTDVAAWSWGNSISVRLLLGSQAGSASCLFDSVRLYRSATASVVDVPATDTLGSALLVLFLATAGIAFLRR